MKNTVNTVNFTAIVLMVAVIMVFLFVYMLIYKRLKIYTRKTDNKWDDLMLDIFKIPFRSQTRRCFHDTPENPFEKIFLKIKKVLLLLIWK